MKKYKFTNESGISHIIFTEIDKELFPQIDVDYIWINDCSALTENDTEMDLQELFDNIRSGSDCEWGCDIIEDNDIEELKKIVKSWNL